MSQSVWPYDHARLDSYGAEKALGDLWCFVICPANPPAYWDDLFAPRTTGSTSPPFPIDVAKGSQTITFPTLPNHTYGDPPFTVAASSSSGLPVTLTVVSGPATIAGTVLTVTGAGVVTLLVSQPGDTNYLPGP